MKDVLIVPRMKKNLPSISSLEDRGYRVAFVDGQDFVWTKGSRIHSIGVIGVQEGGPCRVVERPTQ